MSLPESVGKVGERVSVIKYQFLQGSIDSFIPPSPSLLSYSPFLERAKAVD